MECVTLYIYFIEKDTLQFTFRNTLLWSTSQRCAYYSKDGKHGRVITDHEVKRCKTANETVTATTHRFKQTLATPSFETTREGVSRDDGTDVDGAFDKEADSMVGNGVVGNFVEGEDDNVSRVGKGVVGTLVPSSAVSGVLVGNGVARVVVGRGDVSASVVSGEGTGVCSVGKGVVGDSTEVIVGIPEEAILASVSVLVKSLPAAKKSVVG